MAGKKKVTKPKPTSSKRKIKSIAKRKPSTPRKKSQPVPEERKEVINPSMNNQKQVYRYKVIGKNGRPLYVTETYRKELKQNKLYVQEVESFERVRLQTVPVDLSKCVLPDRK